jgi:hypothetical protein
MKEKENEEHTQQGVFWEGGGGGGLHLSGRTLA